MKKIKKKIYIKQTGGSQYSVILLQIKNRKDKVIDCPCIFTIADDIIRITPPVKNKCKLGTDRYRDYRN